MPAIKPSYPIYCRHLGTYLVVALAWMGCGRSAPGERSKTSDILFESAFDGPLDLRSDWIIEGTGTAESVDGKLALKEYPDGEGVVAWLRQRFPDSIAISFDLAFNNNRGIGVFFFAVNGPDGADPFEVSPARTGAYDEYIRGSLDGYSLSLHRFWPDGRNNPGSNLRRNSGFHLLHTADPDPALESGRTYAIRITKNAGAITVSVDGLVVHDAVDAGFGDPWTSGHVGFRLRGDHSCVMTIDNLRIERTG